jgi:glycosyltransferase involved in cell wall biosynthesis
VAMSIFVPHPSALLTDHRPHGDGLVAHGFIRALAARGHELHVAAEQVDMRGHFPPNVHIHVLGADSLPGPLARLEYMRRMRRLYLQLRQTAAFDVIHQLNPVHVGLTLSIADTSLPVVLGPYVPAWPRSSDSAETVVDRFSQRLNALMRAAQQRRATTVLLSTPAAAAKLQREAGDGLHVREISHGIDERVWTPGNHGSHGQDVLFLANVQRRKGIFVLLDAFERLSGDLPAASLVVAGTGSEGDEVRRRVERSSALRRVEIVGHVDRERVPDVMRACSVYCLPSFGEPFGMTALEAMACGKPVVATDAGGLRHLVDDAGGRRVPTGDAAALATALRDVLVSPELQRQMGHHNRIVVEQRYAWARVIDRLEDVYREAIAAPRSLRAKRLRSAAGARSPR